MRETADFIGADVVQGRVTSAMQRVCALRTRESVQEKRLAQARRVQLVNGKVQPRWWVVTADNYASLQGAIRRRKSTSVQKRLPFGKVTTRPNTVAATSCAPSNPLSKRHHRYQRWHQRFVDPAQAQWHGIGRTRQGGRCAVPAQGEEVPLRRRAWERKPASGKTAAEQPWPQWRGSEAVSTYSLHGARAPNVAAKVRGPNWSTAAKGALQSALRSGETSSRSWMAGHATVPSRVSLPLSRS